ncbi:4'-phosphopantetheinyl transferase superfamily protein [Thiomonas sp. FB-Cd]|uniref:4'-phosphopantetheinyl transferase family protein n=1 Tax=Thiomonas sp. FB-Cd TaxID=1158292 RepID=UPI00068D27AE|nr:4'-phosphopantetheinyl transferase superfamily protein [Thiomonas sp. FB-Cd]
MLSISTLGFPARSLAPALELPTKFDAGSKALRHALPLGRDVHVWFLDLHDMGPNATSLLDVAEMSRAQRFVYEHDWRRYVAAHAWLRRILASYTGVDARHLRFVTGPHGKPQLAPTFYTDTPLPTFSLSHSKDWALVAVAAGVDVGVDIEAVRADLPGADLAAAVLTDGEKAELDAIPTVDHAAAFVGCWARKESCLKALGIGLGLEPRALYAGVHAQRCCVRPKGEGAAGHVDVAPLPAPPGFAAALAAVDGFANVHHLDDAARLAALRLESVC